MSKLLLLCYHSIFYTSAGVGGELDALFGIEAVDRLDQTDRADRNEIVRIVRFGIILFYDVAHEPQISLNEKRAGGRVTVFEPLQRRRFLFGAEGLRKAGSVVDVQNKIE